VPPIFGPVSHVGKPSATAVVAVWARPLNAVETGPALVGCIATKRDGRSIMRGGLVGLERSNIGGGGWLRWDLQLEIGPIMGCGE